MSYCKTWLCDRFWFWYLRLTRPTRYQLYRWRYWFKYYRISVLRIDIAIAKHLAVRVATKLFGVRVGRYFFVRVF